MNTIDFSILEQTLQALPTLPANDGQSYSLSSFKGKNIVLYFYPKDSTSGCTLQAQGYRDLASQFEAANTVILGISRDSVKSHCNFIDKQELNFLLLSDKDKVWHDAFQVLKPKKMYGKDVIGVVRSTFIFNETGVLTLELRDVKAAEDPYEVLKRVQELNNGQK